MGEPRRPHWADAITDASLLDTFAQRTGVKLQGDTFARVRRAADAMFHPEHHAEPTRRCGRPEEDLFNACVVATTDLVAVLRGKRRHDWPAITLAMIYPGHWGPSGWNTRFHVNDRKRLQREATALCQRIEEAYGRAKRRAGCPAPPSAKRRRSKSKRLNARSKLPKRFNSHSKLLK